MPWRKTGEHEKTVPRDAPVLFPVREVPEILYRRAAGEHGRRNRHDAYYLYRPAPSFHHGSGAEIVECIEPAYLTHELFGDYGEISEEKLKIQMAAIGADGKGGKPISLCG